MSDISPESVIWYPGIYEGRMTAEYMQVIADVSLVDLVELVQRRATEDGEFAIANGLVGENNENEPKMRRMMEFVSNTVNIEQCVGHILKEEMQLKRTVDWVCRDLANASKVMIR